MGRRQAVRHRFLESAFVGSNPTAPAIKFILSNENKTIKLLNTLDGNVIGAIGNGNIVFLEKCKIDWCLVSFGDYRGWINKKNIWGVKEKEIIKINIFQRFEDLYWKSVNSLNKIQKKL